MEGNAFGAFIAGIILGVVVIAFLAGNSLNATRLLPYKDGQVCVVEGRNRVVECFTEATK